MSYPTFESRYGQLGAAQAMPEPVNTGAGGAPAQQAAPPQAANPWSQVAQGAQAGDPWGQKLDPWAFQAQQSMMQMPPSTPGMKV